MATTETLPKDVRANILLEVLKERTYDSAWITKNYARLREQFKDMFIAVRNGEVVESNKDLRKLLEKLQKYADQERISIHFISSKELKLLLRLAKA